MAAFPKSLGSSAHTCSSCTLLAPVRVPRGPHVAGATRFTCVGLPASAWNRYLGDNLLDSTLPDELGFLATLRELRVGDNRLEGTLPASIVSLPNLRVLYVFSVRQ